jgi:predicted RND superfamily exporter protein
MITERAFVTSAFQGMTIAAIFALIVLVIATKNIIQATVSLLCVGVVIVSVFAVMKLLGWEIGIAESINIVILIGFAIDYIVHLSTTYMHSAL